MRRTDTQPIRAEIGKTALAVGVTAVVLWGVLAVVAASKTQSIAIEAEQFVRDCSQLEVGRATISDVTPLLTKYHGAWRMYGPAPPACCGTGSRVAEFVFSNTWQQWVLLTRRTQFVGTIGVNDKGVCDRALSLIVFTQSPFGILVHEFASDEQPTPFLTQLNSFKTITTLTAAAPPAQRVAAYAINLDCLTKPTQCRNARDLAPGVWQNSREVAPGDWVSHWDQ